MTDVHTVQKRDLKLYGHEIGDDVIAIHTAGLSRLGLPEYVISGAAEASGLIEQTFNSLLGIILAKAETAYPLAGSFGQIGTLTIFFGDATAQAAIAAPNAVELATSEGRDAPAVLQIVIADRKGRLPWDEGRDPTIGMQHLFFAAPTTTRKH